MQDRLRTEIRRGAVAHTIFCPVTGQVLDVRSAVLLESTQTGQTLAVVSADGWRLRRSALTAAHEKGILSLRVDNAPRDAPFEPTAQWPENPSMTWL